MKVVLTLTILLFAESLQTTFQPKKASKPKRSRIVEPSNITSKRGRSNVDTNPTRPSTGLPLTTVPPIVEPIKCVGLFCPSKDKLTKKEIKMAEAFKKDVLPLLPEARKITLGEGIKANKDIVSPNLVYSRQYKRMLRKFKTHEAIVNHFKTALKYYKLTTKIESGYLPTDKEKQPYIDSLPKIIQKMYNNADDKVKDTLWAAHMLKLSKAYKPIRVAIKEKKTRSCKRCIRYHQNGQIST